MADEIKKCEKCKEQPATSNHKFAKYCESCKIDVKLERREQRKKAKKAAKKAAKKGATAVAV